MKKRNRIRGLDGIILNDYFPNGFLYEKIQQKNDGFNVRYWSQCDVLLTRLDKIQTSRTLYEKLVIDL